MAQHPDRQARLSMKCMLTAFETWHLQSAGCLQASALASAAAASLAGDSTAVAQALASANSSASVRLLHSAVDA